MRGANSEVQKEMSTQELLLAWQDEGQQSAFEALFEHYYARIYRVLYRMVGDEAEDLVRETSFYDSISDPRGKRIRIWEPGSIGWPRAWDITPLLYTGAMLGLTIWSFNRRGS